MYGLEEIVAGTEHEEPLRQEILRVTDQLKPKLQAFVETVDLGRRWVIKLLQQVRTEMRKFESGKHPHINPPAPSSTGDLDDGES